MDNIAVRLRVLFLIFFAILYDMEAKLSAQMGRIQRFSFFLPDVYQLRSH